MLKTQRSEDPLSKSMLMVWPPIVTGERYSTSPLSGVAVTFPAPVEPLVAAAPVVAPVPADPVDLAPAAAAAPVGFAEPLPFFFPVCVFAPAPVPVAAPSPKRPFKAFVSAFNPSASSAAAPP